MRRTHARRTQSVQSAQTVAAWRRAHRSLVDESIVVEALEDLRVRGWLTGAAPPLTGAETSFLSAHGGVEDNREALVRARIASRLRDDAVDRDSLSVEQVADLLGVSASRVRHRIGDGSLFAAASTGRGVARAIPAWQFRDGAPVPHLADVLAELPGDFRATEVRDFVSNSLVDDPARGTQVPLLDWLEGGGDPAPARALAAAQRDII